MEKVSLDVTSAIQSLKKQVELWGKDVKGVGPENSVIYCISVTTDELNQLLGVDVSKYSIKEICNKVLDKAVNLSVAWKYEVLYKLIPNDIRPKEIKFEIGNMLKQVANTPISNEVVNDKENIISLKKGEEQMSEIKSKDEKFGEKGKHINMTKSELDYIALLYSNGEDMVRRYVDNKHLKAEVEFRNNVINEFKQKYSKYNSVDNKKLWGSFYRYRLLPFLPEKNKKAVKEKRKVVNKDNREIISDTYKKYMIEYWTNLGEGEYIVSSLDFAKNVIHSNYYTDYHYNDKSKKNKYCSGLPKRVKEVIDIVNQDDNFPYHIKYRTERINKDIKERCYSNMQFIFTITLKEKIADDVELEKSAVRQSEAKKQCTSCKNRVNEKKIDKIEDKIRYVKYTIGFSLAYYRRNLFGKLKKMFVLNEVKEYVVNSYLLQEELDKMVRYDINFSINQLAGENTKYLIKIEQVNFKDYNIISVKNI